MDMAVFGEILKNRKPTLHAHLSRLQKRDDSPPLTDVFTMHWFLTLFIHCLPSISVLRVRWSGNKNYFCMSDVLLDLGSTTS